MKTLYWSTTIVLAIFLLWSAYTYMFSKATIEGVRELGFPDHFRVQLALLKIVAVLLLLVPQVPLQVKEWAYAGIVLFFITAIVAHTAHKDPVIITFINIFFIGVTIVSNLYLHKLFNLNNPL